MIAQRSNQFAKSIKMSIEHGHANWHSNDYLSVAYWYQMLPTAPFPQLPDKDYLEIV